MLQQLQANLRERKKKRKKEDKLDLKYQRRNSADKNEDCPHEKDIPRLIDCCNYPLKINQLQFVFEKSERTRSGDIKVATFLNFSCLYFSRIACKEQPLVFSCRSSSASTVVFSSDAL